MPSPSIRSMTEKYAYPVLDGDSSEQFPVSRDDLVLFFSENPEQFPDQQAAFATAEAVMGGLMDTQNGDETSMREREIERIWGGDGEGQASSDETPAAAGQTLTERLDRPKSRRDLLRGNLP